MPHAPTLLVTGASGQLSRRVIDLLLEAKAGPVIAVTRSPEKIEDLARKGVEIRKGDFDHPASLEAAFAGADRVLIVSTDAVGRPGGRHSQHVPAVKAAIAAGVKHVVYTSAVAATPTSRDFDRQRPLLDRGRACREQARLDDPAQQHLHRLHSERPSPAIASGELYSATGTGGRNYVTREDCARAAAGALLSDFNGKRILDVTGPAPVTQNEIAAIVSELTGKPIKHIAVSGEALKKGMEAAGLPPAVADLLVDFDVAAAQGYHAIATSAVKDLGGKEPTSVREYLAANRAALVAAA